MLHLNEVLQALGTETAISPEMKSSVALWERMLRDDAPWLDANTQSLGLAAAVAAELARLSTVELSAAVSGSARADYLAAELGPVLETLRNNVEFAAACGGMVFKPYVDGGHIAVDCVPAWRFFPTAFNSRGEITGAVFVEQARRGNDFYTRMESHLTDGADYTVLNRAFKSDTAGALGEETTLSAVSEWASLAPELTLRHRDGTPLGGALFAYFRMPFANTIDPASPLGVSAFGRATGLIKEADRQFSRILWEYEGSELAVDATQGALRLVNGGPAMPERRRRLFRELSLDLGGGGDLYKVFSPAIRDVSLFNGLDKILKRIEFACYLSYGTLSDPMSVEKTAEEIKTSKQRSYTAVCDIQRSLEAALSHLVWCMDVYASLYRLAPEGAYDAGFTWGDGVSEDVDKEFMRRFELTQAGLLKPEKFMAWYMNISEEEALREFIPKTNPAAMAEQGGETDDLRGL